MLFIVEKPKKLFPDRPSQPVQASPKPNENRPPTEEEVYYPNCAAVREAGKAPLHAGEPGYSKKLDRDGDGIACE
ncbi:excalibur calcium-binding domain-containing protein [Paenibacillaceae bacterium WGS1546]|uniref:excalibur calcium-binding domain-containing protein n=1 Tax=Cohnella sp. WGS1546 TaxID=3366810 RepID=UPI00372D071D